MFSYSLYICNRIIRVNSEHGKFIRLCRGYIIQEPAPDPDIVIDVYKKNKALSQRHVSQI